MGLYFETLEDICLIWWTRPSCEISESDLTGMLPMNV